MTRKNRPLLHYAREMRRDPTSAERRVWRYLRSHPFGHKFRRQVPIGPFIADFYCAALKLVIEIDGSSHDWKFEYDDARTFDLHLMKIRVFRIRNEDTRDPELLEQQVQWMIAQCAPPPHPPAAPSPPRGGGEGY